MTRVIRGIGPRVRARQLTVLATAAAALLAGSVAVAGRADAAVQQTFYVSPSGSGSACTSASPCGLATARSQSEALAAGMTGDLVVQLADGTYPTTTGLTFGAGDSGENGHQVIYQNAPGAHPVISGGSTVTGWTVHDATNNIWAAPVPVGTKSRQLYVNGTRAVLARKDAEAALGLITQTSTGYTVTNSIASWPNVTDVDLVWPAQGRSGSNPGGTFTDSQCQVASAAGSTITMRTPCYTNATTPVPGTSIKLPGVGLPSYLENNYQLLSEPGQFYLDSTAGELYYIPRAGETMSTATVVLPTVQSLLTATSVHDMTFTGLTFAYGTWLPSVTQGVIDTQANELQTTGWTPATLMPANVTFNGVAHVSFSRNTLTHLGAAGLAFNQAGTTNTIDGNLVTDVSGSGIDIGNGDGDYYTPPAPAAQENGDTVKDNYVHDVALEYLGGVGIYAGWVTNVTIAHNDVAWVPWEGITLGWGWGQDSETAMSGNHVDFNRIHDTMESALHDGGSLYINGGMSGSATPSTVIGNYITGDPQLPGALYLDNGAQNIQVYYNVVTHTGGPNVNWLYLQGGGTPATYNDVEANYTDSAVSPNHGYTAYSPTNIYANNFMNVTTWPTTAQNTIDNAGLEAAYSGIVPAAEDRNLAYKSLPYSSSGTAANGNDGETATSWTSALLDLNPYWETDLGAQYTLSRLQIQFRLGAENMPERKGFQIRLSNTAAMTTGTYTVACTQGANPVPYEALYTCALPPGPWQYVAVVKTDGAAFAFGDIRIFGH